MALMLGKTKCDSIDNILNSDIDTLTKRDIVSSIAMFREVYNKLDLWANETTIGTNTKKELDTIINGVSALNELTARLSDTTREYVRAERELWQNNKKWNETPQWGVFQIYDRNNPPRWMR